MSHSGLADRPGGERLLFNTRSAIKQFQALQAEDDVTAPPVAS